MSESVGQMDRMLLWSMNGGVMDKIKYVIWSFEHQAWWGPCRLGYVKQLSHAGRYCATEAGKIVTNSILGEEVALCEVIAERNGAPTVKSLWEGE